MENNKRDKKRYVRELIIMAILLAIVALTISYSVVNITLDEIGVSHYGIASWRVEFDSASVVSKTGNAEVIYNPKVRGLSIHYEIKLKEVGDSVTLKAVIKNKGSIDATLESYDVFGIPTKYEDSISYKVSDENGDFLANNIVLKGSKSKKTEDRYMTLYFTITYKEPILDSDSLQKNFNLGLSLNFVQNCSKCSIK